MIILGNDIGTNWGWAVLRNGKRVESGTWPLITKEEKDQIRKKTLVLPPQTRFIRANMQVREKLLEIRKLYPNEPLIFGYEKVMSHGPGGVQAAHVHGGLLAAGIYLVVAQTAVARPDMRPVHVGTWKKAFVGKGNATKKEYVAAASKRFRLKLTVTKNEDEAAALGVASYFWDTRND